MSLFLKKLATVLNQDITAISFRSVDDNVPGADVMDSQSKDDGGEQLRYLTLDEYSHQAIPRKSEEPFQLRYQAYGESSNLLCAHSYAWHGEPRPGGLSSPNALSMAIEFDSHPVAGATIVFHTNSAGLLAEKAFPQELKKLREQHGNRLCELTSFAISKVRKSRRTLAGLMHMIFLYARQARHMQGILVQTRPHHAGVFEKLLGFQVLATIDDVVLLFMPMEAMRQSIRKYGGQPDVDQEESGLYKFFFQQKDEAGLLYRMLEHLAASGTSEGR